MRSTLYVKDEDYRFSYLYGAYVTLSNIDAASMERILALQLSPLYISVHATEEELRSRLLGRSSPPLLPLLKRLVEGGIALHTQVVVCPGFNDGAHLERTLADLLELSPGIRSLAIVPVGLTAFRERLPQLRSVSEREAADLVAWIHERQQDCLKRLGRRFIFAADELYLRARIAVPEFSAYEDFPQIENGVGLIASFRQQAAEVLEQVRPLNLPPLSVVTGIDAGGEVERFVGALADRAGLNAKVYPLANRFFGGEVTVTGLLTGLDVLGQLAGKQLGDVLLLPDVLLREGEDVLLDDVTVAELGSRLKVRIEVFQADPWGLWDILDTLDTEQS
jgi:putative radical SAM enzyme (TIGR03279 family)